METYDEAAFDRFCSALARDGFSPVPGTDRAEWTGPVRPSLQRLTAAPTMRVVVYPGWPFRYAHVRVPSLRTAHVLDDILCLWAEDDPAQIDGCNLEGLWARLDAWAAAAEGGFRVADRALDAHFSYGERLNDVHAELPLDDLVRQGGNGFRIALHATKQGNMYNLQRPTTTTLADGELVGAFYQRGNIGALPRTFGDVEAALTRRQRADLARGLANRTNVSLGERSGGYDFVVLCWARHDRDHDVIVLLLDGAGDALGAAAIGATANDVAARKRRAGPDADLLAAKKALVVGVGSVGGQVALSLAASGVGSLTLRDPDVLKSGNLVRHVCPEHLVGYRKTDGVCVVIKEHAPWTDATGGDALPLDATNLRSAVGGFELVVDCTGDFATTAALAEVCRQTNTPLVTGALFRQGAIARVRRQAAHDTPIAARNSHAAYLSLPLDPADNSEPGFLELGCTAPVNNAPPVAVATVAADIADIAIDFLTGRLERADERIQVLRSVGVAPYDRVGILEPSDPNTEEAR